MKIIVKNLKGKQFEIDVDSENTVREVKEKIHEQEDIEVDTQKLVAVGKVMDDTKTVDFYKLKEGDFIVVMVAKPKVKKEKKPDTGMTGQDIAATGTGMNTAPAQPASQTSGPVGAQAPAPVPDPTATSSAQILPSAGSGNEGGGILRGEALENTLKEMEEMGFARDECMRALRAAYYNPDRAVDYLINGIPSEAQQEANQLASAGAGAGAGAGSSSSSANTFAEGTNPLAGLSNSPDLAQLRQRLISEPQFMQTFISQLAQTHPQLHQYISQNPQAFLQLLFGQGGPGGAGASEGLDNDPPGTIRVTQEEKDAIERLAGLGFPKHRAIEAYFACEKNEEWAANYLFENCNADDNYEDQLAEEESRADGDGQFPIHPPASSSSPDIAMPSNPAPANPAPASSAPSDQPANASEAMDVDEPAANNDGNQNNNNNNGGGDQNNDGDNDDEGEGSSL